MTVYVDDLQNYETPLKYKRWCHMMADDDAELHRMARLIGLKSSWVQRKDGYPPHYDLVPAKRTLAVRNGAVEVTGRQLILEVVRPWRKRQMEEFYEIEMGDTLA